MQFLQTLFGQRIASFVLLLVLVGAIVLAGPALGLDPAHCYLIALGVVLLFVAGTAVAQMKAAKSGASLEQALRSQGKGGGGRPGDENVEDLKKQFDESLALLRQSRLGRGALYKLPWFVIIGPPGSGKTTLLRESGLSFPYMTKGRAAIRGLGGTKNCDWWFADRGVLLDTAGRYVSEHDDRGEWLSFLDMLKKGRKRQPVNGAIVAVSLEDVAFRSETEVRKLADDVRDRIDELTRRLEIVFPVYLVFTKCDGLLGFVETFSGLDKKQRAQVWGFTFPYERTKDFDFAQAFAKELAILQAQLGKRRLGELAVDSTKKRRQLVYRLPNEFAAVRDKLCRFVELIQQENPYQEVSAIRGCYFTSGTQERTALGDLLAVMARKSGVSADELEIPPGERKCYFVDDVFERVVFADGELASPTRAAGKKRRVVKGLQYAAAGAVAVLLAGLAFSRFFDVAALTGDIRQIVTDARNGELPYAQRLVVLEKLRQLTDRSAERSGDPEVHAKLRQEWAIRASKDIFEPAAGQLRTAAQQDSAKPVPAGLADGEDLLAAAERTAAFRAGLERGKQEAVARLKQDERQRALLAYDAWVRAACPGDAAAEARARRLFEAAWNEFEGDATVMLPLATIVEGIDAAFATNTAQLREVEQALLDRMERDGGRMFAVCLAVGSDLQPPALGCQALAADAPIASTAVRSLSFAPIPDGKAPPPSLEDALRGAKERAAALGSAPIDASLAARRTQIVNSAIATFEATLLPNLVHERWGAFLAGVTLAPGLRAPEALATGYAKVIADVRRLCTLYADAIGNTQLPPDEMLAASLGRLQGDVAACAAAKDLGGLVAALERLSASAEIERGNVVGQWEERLRGRPKQSALLAAFERRAIQQVVLAVFETAVANLSAHYAKLRGSHGALATRFPFAAKADDAPAEAVLALLKDLRAHDAACEALPRLAARWLDGGEAGRRFPALQGTPELAGHQTLLARAKALWSCFDLDAAGLATKVWFFVDLGSGVTGFKLTAESKVLNGYSPTSMAVVPGADRSKADELVVGASTPLQMTIDTTSATAMTFADLQTAAAGGSLADRVKATGFPASPWNLFRLCFAASQVPETRTLPRNMTERRKVFRLQFEKPGVVVGAPVKVQVDLLIEGVDHRGELLFTGPEVWQLSFPERAPWR